MDNQHRMITGYRDLGETEIALINEIKRNGNELGHLLDIMQQNPDFDVRWIEIARTDLQRGLSALIRAVARPTTFC